MDSADYNPSPGSGLSRRQGQILALAGILLTAFTLRIAVTSTTPAIAAISADVPFDATTTGLLGMIPPIVFAISGVVTPLILRRINVETLTILAMSASVIGQVGRAMVNDTTLFLILSLFAVGGLGIGNIVLPPLVKKYFPRRIGSITALYVTMLSLSTAIPPLLVVPVADTVGWRLSIGMWALTCVAAMIPWLVLLAAGRRAMAQRQGVASGEIEKAAESLSTIKPWRSITAWGLVIMMGMTSFNTYAMFTWLPQVSVDAGLDLAGGGAMLALFSIMGMPLSLIVPVLAARMRNCYPICILGIVCFAVGYIGVLNATPSTVWIWVTILGFGQAGFPLSLVLINLRSRTYQGAQALSGFAQGLGYLISCLGPLGFGLLHDVTGTWNASFLFLGVSLVLIGVGGYFCCRPRMLEDDLGITTPRAPLT